jgi:hypothetical protein
MGSYHFLQQQAHHPATPRDSLVLFETRISTLHKANQIVAGFSLGATLLRHSTHNRASTPELVAKAISIATRALGPEGTCALRQIVGPDQSTALRPHFPGNSHPARLVAVKLASVENFRSEQALQDLLCNRRLPLSIVDAEIEVSPLFR